MSEAPFDSEEILQRLLAEYPDLLAGDQMDADSPRRWLLVARELGVPGEAGGGDRWSLDHLFLDQEGIPTLVEVKRSSDSRLRREVVGQMLDYAANAVVYWPIGDLRAAFEEGATRRGQDPAEAIRALVAGDGAADTVESYWEQVKLNLQAHRVRLVFVADEIPPELHRVIEFLNEQMDPAEVVGVEIRQFVGEGLQSLVPRVIGQTATAVQRRRSSGRPSRTWDEASFFAALEERAGSVGVAAARDLLDWARPRATKVVWRGGSIDVSMVPVLTLADGSEAVVFSIWAYGDGKVELTFSYLRNRPFFDEEFNRREFLERLRTVPGIDLPPESHNRRPSFAISALASPQTMAGFKDAIEWAWEQLQSHGR